MRKYTEYKVSGVEWLGKIPRDWSYNRLASFGRFSKGNGISKSNLVENGTPVILYGDIYTKYNLRVDNVINFISEDLASVSKLIFKGDILFTGSGETREDIGKCIVYYGNDKVYAGGDTIIFSPKINDSLFLAYSLNSNFVVNKKAMDSKGDIIVHIYSSSLRNIFIPIPPLPEQNSIVRFLDYKTGQIDRFIANRQKQIELLKEQKAGIINKAVTKGINPNAKMKDSGIEWIGEVPEGWQVLKLKYVLKISNGAGLLSEYIKEEGEFEVIGGNGVLGYTNSFNVKGITIAIGRVGAKCGNVHFFDRKVYVNDNAMIVKPFKRIVPEYLFLTLETLNLNNLSNATAQPLLTSTAIKNQFIGIGELSEQKQILNYLKQETSTINNLISKYQKQIDLMQEYRTSLISQAVTGKIDVREWEPKRKAV